MLKNIDRYEEGDYKPTEVKSAFDGSYVLSESKGDKNKN